MIPPPAAGRPTPADSGPAPAGPAGPDSARAAPARRRWQAARPGAVLDAQEAAERRQALRTLLGSPLLAAAGPDPHGFALVRRHAAWLRQWFARNAGWSLHVDADFARLRKVPADTSDATRAACARRGDVDFTRRRYVLLCLALAALEREDRQTALGRLAKRLVALTEGDPALAAAGVRFDLSTRDQRRDLVAVARLLLATGILVRIHGEEESYLADRGDVLYTINRPVLAAMLATRRPPSTVDAERLDDRLAAITEEPLPDSDEGRLRRLRTRVVRRLLDDPVTYYDDLDDDELDYLHRSRAALLGELAEATGLVAEVRREGVALVDDRGDATDLGLPEEGTDGHVALLLAEHLAGHLREAPGTVVSRAALHRHVADLVATHRRHWRRAVTEPGAEVGLADQTVERLAALRLVRVTCDGVVPLPAIARFALQDVEEAP